MDAQEDEPGSLWPPSQAVHSSVAPDENVFSRQATEADRSVLGTLPGSALLQKPARIALNSPALSQGLQTDDPNEANSTAEQSEQPLLAGTDPGSQLEQLDCPVPLLNLPLSQVAQLPALPSEKVPWGQRPQGAEPSENSPAPQAAQLDCPRLLLYLPVSQVAQLSAFPSANFPLAHCSHEAVPSEYSPASQAGQIPWPSPSSE